MLGVCGSAPYRHWSAPFLATLPAPSSAARAVTAMAVQAGARVTVRAFGTGAFVTVALIAASLMPLLAGIIFDAAGAVGVFFLVAAMYAVMAAAVRFGPEAHGLSLEDVSEVVAATRM